MTDGKVLQMPEPLANTGFCPIPSSLAGYNLCNYAMLQGKMARWVGEPGMSKTTTLEKFIADNPRQAFLCTGSPASSTLVPALQRIAEAIGAVALGTGAYEVRAAIIRRIGELSWADRRLVLLADEAQHWNDLVLEEVRSIHDATRIGVALVGNATFVTRFVGKGAKAHFAQLDSRLGMKLEMDGPLPRDVDVLCKYRDVRGHNARKYLRDMAERHKGLRQVFELIDFARIEVGEGRPIEHDHLRAAAAKLWGVRS